VQVALTHALMRYGGLNTSDGYQGNLHNNGGTLTLRASTLSHSRNYGLFQGGGTTLLTDTQVLSTTTGYAPGVGLQTQSGVLRLSGSTVRANSGNGIDARNTILTMIESEVSGNAGHGVYGKRLIALTLTNTTVTGNAGYAAYLNFDFGGAPSMQVSGNTVSGNSINGLGLAGWLGNASTPTSLTLPLAPELPYVLDGLGVNNQAQLTIPAGAVLKFSSASNRLDVYGTLDAPGISASPIVFTSRKNSPR